MYLGDIGVADLAERRRGRDRKPLLPVQKANGPVKTLRSVINVPEFRGTSVAIR